MKSRIYIIVIVLIVLVVLVGACRKAGSWLVKEDQPQQVDAMVMLMGSIADRVLQTADLYSQDVAGKVVIVEEGMEAYRALEKRGVQIISNTSRVLHALVALGIPADSIMILPGGATSTAMEAVIICDYLATAPGIESVLIVSTAPHTRRASMILSAAFRNLENPVSVYCSPSRYTDFNAEKWWRNKEDIQKVLMEYMKMADFIFFEKRRLKRHRTEKGTP